MYGHCYGVVLYMVLCVGCYVVVCLIIVVDTMTSFIVIYYCLNAFNGHFFIAVLVPGAFDRLSALPRSTRFPTKKYCGQESISLRHFCCYLLQCCMIICLGYDRCVLGLPGYCTSK